ncbi:MAG: hypothetical protein QOD09_4967 [Bradyrhizobium sp.]|nr:hypothetical protein [Bradyrhizobium sp.]
MAGKVRGIAAQAPGVGRRPADVDLQVAALGPAECLQGLAKHRHAGLSFRVVGGKRREHADAPHPVGRLGARPKRPCGGGAAE